MKALHRPHLILASLVAGLILPHFTAAAGPASETSWTNVEGVTIWAQFAGVSGDKVLLIRGGREYRVPVSRLTPESAAKVERLHGAPLAAAEPVREVAAVKTSSPGVAYRGPSIQLPSPVGRAISGGLTLDRHAMPLYPFSVRRRMVRTTAYTCDESDHLIYGNKSALGTELRDRGNVRSAAADWSVYPVGTMFSINGLPGVFVVDDYGSALTGTGTIDIYQPSRSAMARWGRRNVEVTVIRWGSLTRSAEILRQRQGASHCRKMLAAILRHRQPAVTLAAR